MSDTSRHWDNICFGIVTLATAALAAMLIVAGFADTAEDYTGKISQNLNYLRIATAGFGFVSYLAASVLVFIAVFLTGGAEEATQQRKRRLATLSYGLLIVQALAIAGILVINVLIEQVDAGPADLQEPQCQSLVGADCCLDILLPDGTVSRLCPNQ